jgi:hypothetical protein
MKVTIELPSDQSDRVVIKSLMDAYESCVTALMDQSRHLFDPVEDVIRRQAALSEVLSYYMLSTEYTDFIRHWNTMLMEKTLEKDQDN